MTVERDTENEIGTGPGPDRKLVATVRGGHQPASSQCQRSFPLETWPYATRCKRQGARFVEVQGETLLLCDPCATDADTFTAAA